MSYPYYYNQVEESVPCILFYDKESSFVPFHWHKEIEIVYSLRGETLMSVNDTVYNLGAGDIAVAVGGDAHGFFRTQGHKRAVLLIAPETFDSAAESATQGKDVSQRMKDIARISTKWQPEHAQRAREILDEIAAISQERVFAFVEQNYHKDLDLDTAAQALGFSTSYFARFFKRFTNNTFMSYLNGYRIRKAQWMLANENKSITQVSGEAGFNSIKTFNREFRAIAGCTPSEYRKSIFESNKSGAAKP